MKIAVTGKGGVGKTTLSGVLSAALRQAGHNVIAVDADPDSNLLACMGYPHPESVPPLVELKELIEERTGAKAGTIGGIFRMNPPVDDIPAKYAVDVDGVRVLVAGAVKRGGSGCYCPENALVRTLVSHLLLDEGTSLVLDMEAGVEHLSRGTVGSVDRLLVVVEPGRRSVETAVRVQRMATDLGVKRIAAVGNRIRSDADESFLKQSLSNIPFAGFLPYDEKIRNAEIAGAPAWGTSTKVDAAVQEIVRYLT